MRDAVSVETAERRVDASWVAHASLGVFAAWIWLATAVDLWSGGLQSSNGKFVSIFDSLTTCCGFRNQRPVRLTRVDSNPPSRRRGSLYHVAAQLKKGRFSNVLTAAYILVLNLLNKFGPATVVSLLTHSTPVVLKGPRHIFSFLACVCLVQVSVRDLVYRSVASPYAAASLAHASALYKLRKCVFIAEATRDRSLGLAGLLTWLVVDGGSDARRLTNYWTSLLDCLRRGDLQLSPKNVLLEVAHTLRESPGVVAKAVVPNVSCAVLLKQLPSDALARLLVLAYLLHRYKALPAFLKARETFRSRRPPLPAETPPTPVGKDGRAAAKKAN